MADSSHIETSRLIAFMLDDGELTRAENTHLFYCSVCSCGMIEASVEELLRREDDKVLESKLDASLDASLSTLTESTGS